jgi:hypothetical protein
VTQASSCAQERRVAWASSLQSSATASVRCTAGVGCSAP